MIEEYANEPYAAGKVIIALNKPLAAYAETAYGLDLDGAEVLFRAPKTDSTVGDIVLLHLKNNDAAAVLEAVDKLNADPAVLYAEPDYLECLHVTPNDPLYNQLWGIQKIGAPSAWRRSVGSARVAVGVIDSGIDHYHPDISRNMWASPNRRLFNGWNFAENNGNSLDTNGHGTHVAGTIGAVGNNRLGITGVCWRVKVVSLKFGLDIASAIASIQFANQFCIPILNASWGGRAYSQALKYAIDHYNGLFIASAGNDGTNNDQDPVYPASYDCANIISVAAATPEDTLASFSNYGVQSVDIAAPGTNILSLGLNRDYSALNGTSMAAPHVAGAAALLKAYRPNLSTLALKRIILSSAVRRPAFVDSVLTGGILNVNAMLQRARHEK